MAGVYELDWDSISKYFPIQSRKTVLRSNVEFQNTRRATIKFKNKPFDSEDNVNAVSDTHSKTAEYSYKTTESFKRINNKTQWHWLCYVLLGFLLLPCVIFGFFFIVHGGSIEMPEITIAIIYAFFCVYSLIFRKIKSSVLHGIIMIFIVSMNFYVQIYCEDNLRNYGSVDSNIVQEAVIGGCFTASLISLVFFAFLRTTLCVKCRGKDAWSILRDNALMLNKKIDLSILIILIIVFIILSVVHLNRIMVSDI